MKRRGRSAWLGLLMLCIAPAAAQAGDAAPAADVLRRADAAFGEGKAAYARKDFPAAAEAFERANQVVPHGRTSYLAGLSWTEAGDPGRACEALERAIALGGLRKDQAADASRRLADLAPKVGRARVRVVKPARGSVDGRPEISLPASLCLAPGVHTVRAIFESGEETSRTFELGASATAEIDVALPEPPAPVPPPASEPPPALQQPIETPVTPPRGPLRAPQSERSSARLPFYIAGGTAFGLSAVSIGAMAGLGTYTISLRDDFVEGGRRDVSQHDAAVTARTLTNVALGFGCAFAAAGVILFAVAPSEPASPKPRTSVGLGPAGFTALVSY